MSLEAQEYLSFLTHLLTINRSSLIGPTSLYPPFSIPSSPAIINTEMLSMGQMCYLEISSRFLVDFSPAPYGILQAATSIFG